MKTIISAFLLLFALHSFAGGKEGGNGGVSVVCRDEAQQIVSAEILDIFEGRRMGRSYQEKTSEELLAMALERLKPFSGFYNQTIIELETVKKILVTVGPETVLELTKDALPIMLQKGCEYEQLATYTDDGYLFVSEEIFQAQSNVGKAALLLHEAIYALDRKLGAEDSTRTRRIVGMLLAEELRAGELEKILSGMKLVYDGFYKTKSKEGHVATHVVIKKGEQGPMISFNGPLWCGDQAKQKWYALEAVYGAPYAFKVSSSLTEESELSSLFVPRYISFANSDRLLMSETISGFATANRQAFKRYDSPCMK